VHVPVSRVWPADVGLGEGEGKSRRSSTSRRCTTLFKVGSFFSFRDYVLILLHFYALDILFMKLLLCHVLVYVILDVLHTILQYIYIVFCICCILYYIMY